MADEPNECLPDGSTETPRASASTSPTPAPSTLTPATPSQPPTRVLLLTIGDVNVYRVGDEIWWTSGVSVEIDGAPDAYHPAGCPPGRDLLGNAHKNPHDLSSPWVGVVLGPDGKPVIQGPNDPCPGFMVSPSALRDHSIGDEANPRRYVDASKIPGISIPPQLTHPEIGAKLGDVAWVTYKGTGCSAIVYDVGPHGKIGEGSVALARQLGIPSSPVNGGVGRGVSVRLFLNSAATPAWPRSVDSIDRQVNALRATLPAVA